MTASLVASIPDDDLFRRSLASSTTSILIMTPPCEATTLPGTSAAFKPKLSNRTTSYRKLASKDPLREEGIVPRALTAYEEYYSDPAARPSDDLLQVLREGPSGPPLHTAFPTTTANFKQFEVEPTKPSPFRLFLGRNPPYDACVTSSTSKILKLGILARKTNEPKVDPASLRHREHSIEMKGLPGGLGMGSIPDYPRTTADQARERVADGDKKRRDGLRSTKTTEDAKRMERESVEAWMKWTARCVATNTVLTDFARQSQCSSSSRTTPSIGVPQRSVEALRTPVDTESMTNYMVTKVAQGSKSAFRSRAMSLAPQPSSLQDMPSWTGQASPFDEAFFADAVNQSLIIIAVEPRRNPLISLRPHNANNHIRPLLVELAQTIAHYVSDVVSLSRDTSLEAYVKQCSLQGNRRRSDMIFKLRDEQRHPPRDESSRDMVAWLSQEVSAMMMDIDDALGPPGQFTRLIEEGQYALIVGNSEATVLGDELQLLVDLEELLWGMGVVSMEDLPYAEDLR